MHECPLCDLRCEQLQVLARHLTEVHKMGRGKSRFPVVTCWCGELFISPLEPRLSQGRSAAQALDQFTEHLRTVGDLKSHATLGLLEKIDIR